MKVTKVYFREMTNPQSKLLAFASVVVDDTMIVPNFKVFNGRNGIFAKVPQERNGDKYYDAIRWCDDKYYQEGNTETHPVLVRIVEEWEKHTAKNQSQDDNGNSEDQPW
jgi:DNA-binding cell septation regulator SpoVG